jgi:hypothetical protein
VPTCRLSWLCLAYAFVAARPFLPVRGVATFSVFGTYEALAHLLCGGLFGAWAVGRRPAYGWAALALVAVEVAVAVCKR